MLFSAKVTIIHIYFLLLCFSSRNPPPTPSYSQLLNISLFLLKNLSLHPGSPIFLNVRYSRNLLVLIQSLHDFFLIWLWKFFLFLFHLLCLHGTAPFITSLCILKSPHLEKEHLLIWWLRMRRSMDFYNSEETNIFNMQLWIFIS